MSSIGPEGVALYQYATEEESVNALDRVIGRSGLFQVYRECIGTLLGPRVAAADVHPKIDRILLPDDPLVAAGWELGPIGIEAKKSGEKIGPAIAQALDYAHSAFEFRKGYHVVVEWVFLWPFTYLHHDLASVMVQHRIGVANLGHNECSLALRSADGQVVLDWSDGRGIKINNTRSGKHQGRR